MYILLMIENVNFYTEQNGGKEPEQSAWKLFVLMTALGQGGRLSHFLHIKGKKMY